MAIQFKDIFKNKGGFYEFYIFDKPGYKYIQNIPLFGTRNSSSTDSSIFGNLSSKSIFREENDIFGKNGENNNKNINVNLFGRHETFSSFENEENKVETGGLFGKNNHDSINNSENFNDSNKNKNSLSNNSKDLFRNYNINNNNSIK